MRDLVMGDIHGAYKAFLQVLERCGFNPETDRLIQLGDIVDGWSESAEITQYLIDLKKEYPHHIFIRGNHDVWAYDWLHYGRSPLLWTQQGGQATIDSYIRTSCITEQSHRDFYKNQLDWYIDEINNNLYIHGGWYYINGFPNGANLKVNAGSIAKECHWDRSLYETAKSAHFLRKHQKDGLKKFTALDQFNEVYIGHTAQTNKSINQYLNLWNCDAGAGWKGRLGIIDINTKETWYSDECTKLYPNELGR